MSEVELKKLFQIEDILSLPNAIFKIIFDNDERLHHIYRELLQLNTHDLSRDWFQDIYEGELAQRNQNKQDFTPNVVGILLSRLTGVSKGVIYEPTAGNGSLIISNWWHRVKTLGTDFKPSEHPVECWELSDRSIPLLLLNLSIRGINATVYHGDVLVKSIKSAKNDTNSENVVNEIMPKPRSETGDKNLISGHLKALRKEHHMSQRELANQLQLLGVDMDKNVITRIETNKRYVTDIELQALAKIFGVSYEALIDGVDKP